MANDFLRQAAARNGVKLWRIADHLGMTDSAFSRKLRRELSEDEQNRIIGIINEIAGGEDNAENKAK